MTAPCAMQATPATPGSMFWTITQWGQATACAPEGQHTPPHVYVAVAGMAQHL